MLEKIFHYRESGSSIKIEILAGIVTFMTMSYIIFVQPAILSQAGMDFGSVMVATCIGSALTTILMGLYANYPIALAPGMGENFFFAFTIVLTMQLPWQIALGAVFIEGILFILLTAFNLRKMIVDAISESL